MITKQQIFNAIPDVYELPQWKLGVAALDWIVRIEDGAIEFNENLHRDYCAALAQTAAAQLRQVGFNVTQPSFSSLLVN
ncbi:hypothetical protein UNDKW_1984 [Undibacterium sp. KW1]|uniref:hypothetical protein n=1 Tax=Undibacterium sp. KW1 TaxID=2058624 RepID=UPI001331C7AD|nr:hypothetical protein [Undibacterium sp. KW1]BBB60257.1 hypothetical protein UNDKW_1984 [Undibacterium sp. KW1]